MLDVTLAELQQRYLVGRMWQRDQTVWKPNPTEIPEHHIDKILSCHIIGTDAWTLIQKGQPTQ